MKKFTVDTYICIVTCFICAIGVYLLRPRYENAELKKSVLLVPPKSIKHATFGYNETYADVLWLRLIQNFDLCGNDTVFAKDIKYENGKDLNENVCDRGWSFQMLDAITDIAPNFKYAYTLGGTVLSILVNDKMGAKLIFDKGRVKFPNDWNLFYKSGYHYIFELVDHPEVPNAKIIGANILSQAAAMGAPKWVIALAGKLLAEEGRLQAARCTVATFLSNYSKDEEPPKRAIARLEMIEEEMRKKGQELEPCNIMGPAQMYKPPTLNLEDQ